MSERIHCWSAACSKCVEGVYAGRNPITGTKYYSCSAFPKKHKSISSWDCGKFRCCEPMISLVCDECKGK